MAATAYTLFGFSGVLTLRTNRDVVARRRTVGQVAEALEFSLIGKTMLVTAASELARNTVVHGRGGKLSWSVVGEGDRPGVRAVFEDEGLESLT